MKTAELPIIGRALFTSLIVLNLAVVEAGARSPITFTPNPPAAQSGDASGYAPNYLAQRLGVAQKFTDLSGVAVREHAGRKAGRLEDIVVDLGSGHVLCALVSHGDNTITAVPGKAFDVANNTAVRFIADDVNLDNAPRAGTEVSAIVNSLPACCGYFHQKVFDDLSSARARARKCSELIGAKVQNDNGDSLGRVVNVMVDLPTARVVYVVVNFNGKDSGLYAAPPAAFQNAADQSVLILNVEQSKVAALAHSDGFFWSNMAESNWGIQVYRAFGQQADFDPAAAQTESHAAANPTPIKGDREITKDILTAMMRDDVKNPLIYKNVQIKPSNGQVTLSGQVRNQNQRAKLVSIVASVAGAANVHDELQVK